MFLQALLRSLSRALSRSLLRERRDLSHDLDRDRERGREVGEAELLCLTRPVRGLSSLSYKKVILISIIYTLPKSDVLS